jgi:FlaA1/EpsC-like NDP-sugar epimerase
MVLIFEEEVEMLKKQQFLLFIGDAVIVVLCMYLALLFRFGGRIDSVHMTTFLRILPLIIFIRIFIFWFFGLYRGMWRYVGVKDFSSIIKAVTLGSAILTAVIFFLRLPYPRIVLVADWVLNIVFIGGIRFTVRMWREWYPKRRSETTKRVLIMGAGDAGEMVLREMISHPETGYQPIGFIDDHLRKQGMAIHGVKVLGRRGDIPRLVKERDIEEVIIAMPSASGKVIRNIVAICEGAGVECKTIPGLNELIRGQVNIKEVRDIEFKDLLRRPVVEMELKEISSYLEGKRVLVTGAGGSIGSELCRQVVQFNPLRLIALDHSENNLFYLEHELSKINGNNLNAVDLNIVVGDIRDKNKLRATFECFKPEIIFHAAAHKHVPLMEKTPEEAVKNNIIGTNNLASLADEYKVDRFINISTDKAVNPTNVMGASKRVAEMLIQSKGNSGTCFVSVRFGNVLGSEGSVVPLFRRQIAEGGPVTVTHPEATRYFMTIPEAVQLIVQAGALGKGGEVFVLDMGEPVKILNLARDLIIFSGFKPDEDISIEFVGLRPGEKLHEEPLTSEEGIRATRHKQIFITRSDHVDKEKLEENIRTLGQLADGNDREGIVEKLKEMIPTYCRG